MGEGISLGRAAQQQRIPAEPINDSAVLISLSLLKRSEETLKKNHIMMEKKINTDSRRCSLMVSTLDRSRLVVVLLFKELDDRKRAVPSNRKFPSLYPLRPANGTHHFSRILLHTQSPIAVCSFPPHPMFG